MGKPFYDEQLAKQISRDGTPCFACKPALLPALVEGALKGQDLAELSKRLERFKGDSICFTQ